MTDIRPTLAQATAAIEADYKEGKSHGLMMDAFREAVIVRYGYYATGLEERAAIKSIERIMNNYFNSKKDAKQGIAFTQPERLRELIDLLTVSDPEAVKALTHESDDISKNDGS